MKHHGFPASPFRLKNQQDNFLLMPLFSQYAEDEHQQHEDDQMVAEGTGESGLRSLEVTAQAKGKNAHHAGPYEADKSPAVEQADENAHDGHAERGQCVERQVSKTEGDQKVDESMYPVDGTSTAVDGFHENLLIGGERRMVRFGDAGQNGPALASGCRGRQEPDQFPDDIARFLGEQVARDRHDALLDLDE